jgi:hypothetical protein
MKEKKNVVKVGHGFDYTLKEEKELFLKEPGEILDVWPKLVQ